VDDWRALRDFPPHHGYTPLHVAATVCRDYDGATPVSTRQVVMWSAIGSILLAPLIAMQFTDEVSWTRSDFAAAAVLLVGAGAMFEVANRYTRNRRGCVAIGSVLAGAVLLIWAQGAVGVF
jgi:hypothetical protein